MRVEEAAKAIRKEMDRRRRYGGAEDVPPLLWAEAAVSQAVQRAAKCAQEEGFDGDWDLASIRLEESMEAMAGLLRRLSRQNTDARHWQAGLPRSVAQASQDRFTESDRDRWRGFQSRPTAIRHDAGSRALADYLAWYLRNDGAAGYYRRKICGGDYLTREEAWQFLTSPLPKLMTFGDYERLGLCPAKTQGRIRSDWLRLDELLCVTNMLQVDPKTRLPMLTLEKLDTEAERYNVEISLPRRNKKTRHLKRMALDRSEQAYSYVAHHYGLPRPYRITDDRERNGFSHPQPAPYFSNENRYIEGYSLSVMGELIGIADSLCSYYPVTIWDMLEALLTGRFPSLPAVELLPWKIKAERMHDFDEVPTDKINRFAAQGPVTLTVQPWVTPEALADAWREHRKSNPCYSPSEKQADALHFVLAHTPPGEEFAWERLAGQWEEERGERMTRGQLLKQFQRARAAILPGYRELDAG